MEEHAPDQADHDRVHQQRDEQDGVVDALAALDGVEGERNREADQELEQDDGQDEAGRDQQRVAELRRGKGCQIVVWTDEAVVAWVQEGEVEGAGGQREQHGEEDDGEENGECRGGKHAAGEPVPGGKPHESGRILRIVTPTVLAMEAHARSVVSATAP
jgi:hypothetical protein